VIGITKYDIAANLCIQYTSKADS